ncbi:MAG: L,D-transpeptidase family protein [Acidimicrobiia bacterium]|nr:L,D-transpeptidase family protein [Acidimicrobiia bacterium]
MVGRVLVLLVAALCLTAPACAQPIQTRLQAHPPAPEAEAGTATTAPPDPNLLPEPAPLSAVAPEQPETAVPPGPTLPAGYDAWSATARVQLTAYAAPDPTSAQVARFRDHNTFGDPQTFRIVEEARGPGGGVWYHVLLPIQPNGATGWVRMRDVTVRGQAERLVVDLSERTMRRIGNGVEVGRWRVAIGTDETPTPVGPSYLWTVWTPERGSHKAYGAGVLAMAAMSPTISDWHGGAPRIAIHGTSRPSDIGRAVSHGCVRMLDADLRPLLDDLPLGMPIDVVA